MSTRIPHGPDDGGGQEDSIPEAMRAFFQAAASAKAEQDRFGTEARAAALRLARAVAFHDNSQAIIVAAALASIYNGSEALPVRLDEIRGLDWILQRDLVTVMLGTGHGGFSDAEIRDAFRKAGGEAAVDWFHWWTTDGPHRKALEWLVAFIVQDRHCSTAQALVTYFRSIVHGGKIADLSRLNYMDDNLTEPFALVLEALWGRDQGKLHIEDIQKAFESAGVAELLAGQAPAKTT